MYFLIILVSLTRLKATFAVLVSFRSRVLILQWFVQQSGRYFSIYPITFIMKSTFRNTRLGDFISATASNITFEGLLFENLTIFSSSGVESFLTLFVVDTLTQQNFFLIINNSIFTNLSHGGNTVLSLFISVATNYQTKVILSNLSFMSCNFLNTIIISLNKVSDIVILNLLVQDSYFFGALDLFNSQSLLLKMAFFQNNNQYNDTNVYNSGPALAIQDVFSNSIEGLQILYSRSDVSTLGIIISMPNSLHKGISAVVVLENSIFIGNIAIFTGQIIDGGCAVYISSNMFTSISLNNITFQGNKIEVFPNAEEIVGGAAIRSMGTWESISIVKCTFINQTSTHMSSTILFQGQTLIIIGTFYHFINNFCRL